MKSVFQALFNLLLAMPEFPPSFSPAHCVIPSAVTCRLRALASVYLAAVCVVRQGVNKTLTCDQGTCCKLR